MSVMSIKANQLAERYGERIARLAALLIFLAGCLYALSLGDRLRFLPDESDYLALASNLLTQGKYSLDGSSPSVYRAPGYPIYLLPFIALNVGLAPLRIASFATLALSAYALYRLLALVRGKAAGLLGILLLVGYPVLFFTAGTLYPQTLTGLMFVLVLLLISGPPGRARSLAAGLLLGWLVLTVPTFVFTLPVFLVWLLLDTPRRWVQAGLLAGGALLLFGAWTARNWLVFDTFVFVSANSGENLLVGNSPRSRANAGRTVSFADYEVLAAQMDEVERDRFFRQAALDYIRQNPGEAAGLYLEKVWNYFNYRNELVSEVGGLSAINLVMLLTYGSLLALGLLRVLLVHWYPLHRFEALLVLLYVLSALVTAVFFTRIRFRLPFDYLLLALDALFVDWLVRRLLPVEGPDQGGAV